jgi:hypothetical protein
MQYTTLLEDKTVERLKQELPRVYPGLWMLDLDPNCDRMILGPYDTVAAAHESRDYIWHYGDRYGRYLWLLSTKSAEMIKGNIRDADFLELSIDTMPLEVVGFRMKLNGVSDWIRPPTRKIKK